MNIHFIFCTNKAKHKYNFEKQIFHHFRLAPEPDAGKSSGSNRIRIHKIAENYGMKYIDLNMCVCV